MWSRWLSVILGFWLVSAPFVLGYRVQDAQLNDLCVGLAIMLVNLAAVFVRKLRYATTPLAVWLIVSPFVLGYGDYRNATLNDIIVGLLVGVLSLVWDHRVWTPHRRPLTGS